ncbi:hypothetical protein [Desertivirga brevis]|uniref:hypothetical protein n=1 Tax=Desertivirga brevis TaxID=2810310 RepID=UPI001A96765A|nr:hypothetical protein [Pedobacter sp. SYSU D00873]
MEYINNPQALTPFLIATLIKLIIMVLFCRTQVKTLELIEPENRAVQPWLIWLLIIFESILSFFVVIGMSRSIANELKSRNFEEENSPALIPGIVYAILGLISFIILGLEMNGIKIPATFAPLVAVIGFSQIFFMVQYWSKVTWYKKILQSDDEGDYSVIDKNREEEE